MSEINGYNLTREWYNFRFENPNKAKHVHSDLYFYIIDRWNRFGQKEKFSLPTGLTMEALGIRSYNTYKNAIHDLIEFGFVEVIEWSKNQYCSTVIALSKNDKAMYKALDKAVDKANDKAMDKALQSYINNRTIEQENKEQEDKVPAFNFKKALIEVGANEDLVIEWIQVRKGKKLQQNKAAFDKFMRELTKSKRDINQVLRVCAERSWAGFDSTWPFPDEQTAQVTDDAAKWKAKLAELKSRQTVIEVTTDPTVPTYKILEYHNGKGMSYIAGVERVLENWLQGHWELIPLVKEVQL